MTSHKVFGDELYNLREKRVETADYKGERLYTRTPLHTNAFTHECLYTRTHLRANTLKVKFPYTQTPLHANILQAQTSRFLVILCYYFTKTF